MEHFFKIVNGFKPLTIFAKGFIKQKASYFVKINKNVVQFNLVTMFSFQLPETG